tara:strand:+ start:346 stop:477 length:132 start_codon:yes stop_codon:yes gene_type:complete
VAGWQSGNAAACKAANIGSIPVPASIELMFWLQSADTLFINVL